MGVKSTIAGLTFSPEHHASATRGGYMLEATRRGAVAKIEEAVRDLRVLIGEMPAGDPNVATLAGIIEVLT
jgi:hypothetical protein